MNMPNIGAFGVLVVNPRAEVVNAFESFDTIEQARAYAAHAVNVPGRFVGCVIFAREEIVWPETARANFTKARPQSLPDKSGDGG